MFFRVPCFKGEVDVFIHTQFENKASNRKNSIALIMNESTLSYDELNKMANRIAHVLIEQGVLPGDIVGLCLERSFELIAGIIAVMKVGAAYLPLDTEYPVERLKYMMAHSRASRVLVHRKYSNLFQSAEATTLIFEDIILNNFSHSNPIIDLSKVSLTYVIYTSGSTGRPKGIAMGPGPLINLIEWQNKQGQLGEDTITLQYTPVSFDVHFQEIFSTLISGGTLVLISEQERLDSLTLLKSIAEKNVNKLFIPFVALNHLSEVAVNNHFFPRCLKEITAAGEALKISRHIRLFFEKLDNAVLFNHYGPSETHVVTSFSLSGNPHSWPNLPSIGSPIQNVQLLVLDQEMNEVKVGEEGEIYIGGVCLAEGYLHSEQMTASQFIQTKKWGRLYRSGDMAYMNTENNFVFMGRKDSQIKLRGYRIELGEVELAIEKSVYGGTCAVHVIDDGNESYLCAYVNGHTSYDTNKLREELRATLPEYMVPSYFIKINKIPLTPSGKVDYKNLPSLSNDRPDLNNEFEAPSTPSQLMIEKCWNKFLKVSPLGIDDSFFDLGGNSLMAIKILAEINLQVKKKISIVNFFQFPTIRMLGKFIDEKNDLLEIQPIKKEIVSIEQDIAVIAINGKFPGASNVEEFWDILISQRNPLEEFSLELTDHHIKKDVASDPHYVRMQGIYPGQEFFDYQFFKISQLEAELMDPQQRKFLELSYNAIELAGYRPDDLKGKVGVFAGMGNSKYHRLVDLFPEKTSQVGDFNVMHGLEKDYIAPRVAYNLNLQGPAVSIHTGCSTSLVAIIEAVKSLRLGHCDMALAGGISIYGSPHSGHLFQSGGIFSEDGLCRAFDDRASGTLFTEGGGVVVLKRLEDAKLANDNILAVIKGIGINNDGADKVNFTAPSVNGQSKAILEAQLDAGFSSATIGYIESHGAGTPIGDPIEVEALTRAFERTSDQKQYCYLSSVKSNIGHLTAAAGVASFIKTVLTLKNGVIPGTAHFETPNQHLGIENTPFLVSRSPHRFPDLLPNSRRAGVSSFGVGGTNAHIVLEDYPNIITKEEVVEALESPAFFKISAKTKEQVEELRLKLISQLSKTPTYEWKKIAYTLDVGRKVHKIKDYVIAHDHAQLDQIKKTNTKKRLKKDPRGLVLMFPGFGCQYPEMGKNLYGNIDYFRKLFDECNSFASTHLGYDLRNYLHQTIDTSDLNNPFYSWPSIFVVEYCLAKTISELGFKIEAVIGHSIGEYVAATVAGIFSFEDGLKFIIHRARQKNELPTDYTLLPTLFNRPTIPIYSSVTGKLEEDNFCELKYWESQLELSLKFHEAFLELRSNTNSSLFVETGTKNFLTQFLRKEEKEIIENGDVRFISLLGSQQELESRAFLQALGELWVEGLNYSNANIIHHPRDQKRRIAPVYPFLKKFSWLGPYDDHQPRKLHKEVKSMNDERLSTLKEKLSDFFENGTGIAVNVFNDPRDPAKIPSEQPKPANDPAPGHIPLSPGDIPGRVDSPIGEFDRNELRAIISRQLDLMTQQLSLLSGQTSIIKELAVQTQNAKISKISLDEEVRIAIDKTEELTSKQQVSTSESEPILKEAKLKIFDPTKAPAVGAKIGRDEEGNPAWFIENPDKSGEYFLLEG